MMIISRTTCRKNLKELIPIKTNDSRSQPAPPAWISAIRRRLLRQLIGVNLQFVPYRGTGPALQDLVAGQIDIIVDQASNSLAQVQGGKIRAYGIAADKRLAAAPSIPTVDEAGLPGFYIQIWSGIWVPKGTPKDIVAKLNAAVVDALADPAVRKRLAEVGLDIPPRAQQTPEALAVHQQAEVKKWWPMIKAANIKVS